MSGKLILATVGISIITNYNKLDEVKENNENMFKNINLKEEQFQRIELGQNSLNFKDKENEIIQLISSDYRKIVNIMKKKESYDISAEIKSLQLFKEDMEYGIGDFDKVVLLYSNTCDGYIAAHAVKDLLISKRVVKSENVSMDCLKSRNSDGSSVRIDQDTDEGRLEKGIKVLEEKFKYYAEKSGDKFICLSGGYKIICLVSLKLAIKHGFKTFLNHEKSAHLKFI